MLGVGRGAPAPLEGRGVQGAGKKRIISIRVQQTRVVATEGLHCRVIAEVDRMLPKFKKSEAEGGGPSSTGTSSTRPLGISRGSDRGTPSVIGPDLIIHGNLTSKGEVQVDGEVQGDIHGTYVVI